MSDSLNLSSFPLERPALRTRRREAQSKPPALPYFIAGEENHLVSFLALSEVPIFELGNPVFLVGPSGAGKTSIALHLAARQAVAQPNTHSTGESQPASVLYQTSVDYARQYAEAVAADDLPPLRQQLSEASILVIDDLHLIADKPAAQDELALRIEGRANRHLPTIVTCRRLPSEVRRMRPLLCSRVLPGLTVPIALPVDQSRRQILRELASHHQLDIGDQLLADLDSGLESPLPARALEAAIKQVSLWCRMHQSPVTADAICSAIAVVGQPSNISLATIATAVAKQYRMKLTDLRSSSRKQSLVRARSLAMLLSRRMTTLSMHQIGDYFGGRDHTTVLHAIRKTETLLEEDPELRRTADEVREKLCVA